MVAPSRVRELKLFVAVFVEQTLSRTLTGAWIETHLFADDNDCGCRTLTGAWIETKIVDCLQDNNFVAPSRVRELKQ